MLFALQFLVAEAEQQQAQGSNPIIFALPIILILGYFLLVRSPMKKQEQERQRLLAALKKNDKVVTSGGIIGIVASIKEKEDEVTLKVDESSNVRLRVLKSSIVKIVGGEEAAKEQKESSEQVVRAGK
jgi:preprotein translocase subunit YajC